MPGLRLLKALSVGANRVNPWSLCFTCSTICESCLVEIRSLISVVYWPSLSSIPVMFKVVGDGAGAVWAEVWTMKRRARRRGQRLVDAMLVDVK